jgi:hypothetical protein
MEIFISGRELPNLSKKKVTSEIINYNMLDFTLQCNIFILNYIFNDLYPLSRKLSKKCVIVKIRLL